MKYSLLSLLLKISAVTELLRLNTLDLLWAKPVNSFPLRPLEPASSLG